jgi:phosphatidate cytidylyltransferase
MTVNENSHKEPDDSPSPAPETPGGNMTKRIVTGVLVGALSIALIIWGDLPISLEVLLLAMVGVGEFYHLAERKKIRPSRAIGFLAVFLLIIIAYMGREDYLPVALLGLVMISLLGYIFRKGFHVSSFLDVGVTVLGFLYVGWFFSYVILIRKMEGNPFSLLGMPIERGAGFTLLLIFSTFLTDTGAFFAGRLFGRHKLAPHISPNKTVEGAVGGMLGAVAGAFLVGRLLKISEVDLAAIGILCGIFAQLGDLWASILKRDVNVKDAGSFFAGHGGVLDRVDSLLFTAPTIYFYLKYFY